MKKIIVCVSMLVLIMSLCGCAVVESVKEVTRPLQTPPPLKDVEIIVSEPTTEPTEQPIVQTVVESDEESFLQETPTPSPDPETELESDKLNAVDVFEKRSDDLYIECMSYFGSDDFDVSAYLSGENISATIISENTPINAVVNEKYDYVLIYLDKSFIGAKVTGFEQYNPMKYEDMVLQNVGLIQDLCVDESGVNGYAAVRGMFEYNDKDYVIWYSEEFDIVLKIEVNQTIVYEIKKVKSISDLDMNIFEKPKGKIFVDFGDISEMSMDEIMGFFK